MNVDRKEAFHANIVKEKEKEDWVHTNGMPFVALSSK